MNFDTEEETKQLRWKGAGPYYNMWWPDISRFMGEVFTRNWVWITRTRFKYLDIRVDTRTGTFLIKDRDGEEVTPDDVLGPQRFDVLQEQLAYGTNSHYIIEHTNKQGITRKHLAKIRGFEWSQVNDEDKKCFVMTIYNVQSQKTFSIPVSEIDALDEAPGT